MTQEPLSPAQIEDKLRRCVTDLTNAENDLRQKRDAETEAEIAYRAAHRKAMLSSECPKVTRGGYTTADRDAWVDEQCAVEWEAYRRAQAKCQAAQDHVRTVRDISSTVQSIGSLVRQAFSMAGSAG